MKIVGWVIIGLIVVVVLLLIGIVAGQVGGIAIRRQGIEQASVTLRVSEPIVRGVPVVVRWEVASFPPDVPTLTFDWRDSAQGYRLGEAPVEQGSASLLFPCDASDDEGSLVVRSGADGKVITSQPMVLAAAGPECVQ